MNGAWRAVASSRQCFSRDDERRKHRCRRFWRQEKSGNGRQRGDVHSQCVWGKPTTLYYPHGDLEPVSRICRPPQRKISLPLMGIWNSRSRPRGTGDIVPHYPSWGFGTRGVRLASALARRVPVRHATRGRRCSGAEPPTPPDGKWSLAAADPSRCAEVFLRNAGGAGNRRPSRKQHLPDAARSLCWHCFSG